MQWAEEHIRKDVCRLSSKLASRTNTKIESSIVRLIHDIFMIHSLCILDTSCDSAMYFPLSYKTGLLTFNEFCSWSLFQYVTSMIHI